MRKQININTLIDELPSYLHDDLDVYDLTFRKCGNVWIAGYFVVGTEFSKWLISTNGRTLDTAILRLTKEIKKYKNDNTKI